MTAITSEAASERIIDLHVDALIEAYADVPGAAAFLRARSEQLRELARDRLLEMAETWMGEHGLLSDVDPS